jgi:hypothetical protein
MYQFCRDIIVEMGDVAVDRVEKVTTLFKKKSAQGGGRNGSSPLPILWSRQGKYRLKHLLALAAQAREKTK